MLDNMTSSEYINQEGYAYALYTVLSRAIPSIADGLNPAGRRVMWVGKDGGKYKTANLAAAAMPYHPHASPEGVVNNLTGQFVNNIPMFTGEGAFGTKMKPTAFGAARYTSVKLSPFAKDVMMADIEIVPLQPNYDDTLMEPVHYLPLVPMCIVNPTDAMATAYASKILPRDLADVINSQLQHLTGKKIKEPVPYFKPIDSRAEYTDINPKTGKTRWVFLGEFTRKNTSEVVITDIPFGIVHADVIDTLNKLLEKELINDYTDNSGKKGIEITVKFQRGGAADIDDESMYGLIGIKSAIGDNLNVVDFDNQRLRAQVPYVDIIKIFTDWRLQWYVARYERLLKLLREDIQRYRDVLTAIKKNVSGLSKKTASRSELKDLCASFGIVYTDYIADLPVYRFTEEEAAKVEKKLADALAQEKDYEDILAKPDRRKDIYISELKEVLKKYG